MEKVEKLEKSGRLYRTLWRWHFYAGVILLPFIIILSLSGMVYLFKPQIEDMLDKPYHNLQITGANAPVSAQVDAALKTMKDAKLRHYEVPRHANDAPKIYIYSGGQEHVIFINPQSLEILKSIPKEGRFMAIARNIHGELLVGKTGSYIVEAAASWAIIMIVTGLYLWWPRNQKGIGGILYPRGGKFLWRDIHAVTGIYVSFFAMFLLLTGLPWTDVWGDAFKEVRKITRTMPDRQDWTINRKEEKARLMEEVGGSHISHSPIYSVTIDDIAAHSRLEKLAHPVEIAPPNNKSKNWILRSNSPNRPKRVIIEFSPQNGTEVKRERFEDRHIIDRVVGIGVAAHEGQLFGWFNQALGVITALALCLLSISSFVMWRKRAPKGILGAPPKIKDAKLGFGIATLIIIFGLFLPLLGLSIILIGLIEFLILKRIKPARDWLGIN